MSKSLSAKDIYRRGYSNLKKSIKHNITSKSRPSRSAYLETFILEKHQSRLKQEKANLSRRINQIDEEMAAINQQIAAMKEGIVKEMENVNAPDENVKSNSEIKTLRKMEWNY